MILQHALKLYISPTCNRDIFEIKYSHILLTLKWDNLL